MQRVFRIVFAVLLVMPFALQARAQDEETGEETIADRDFAGLSVTMHTVQIGGKEIAYTATTGTLTLAEEDGDEKAKVFFIAYTRDDFEAESRPITFCFNGGPGSSSVWLHLGAYGPRRVLMGDAGNIEPPPYKLGDNHESILDITDLVFIDPVTTGYSRAVPGEDDGQFHGLNEDIESVGEFIRLYTTRFERWPSPKFLSGESYGTTRAAGLASHLQDRHGMYFNGIVLVSSVLDFGTTRFGNGNDLPYILFLPTYAATNWYHTNSPDIHNESIEDFVEASREFALGDYATALLKGDELSGDERSDIIRRYAHFTGLSTRYIDQANMRVAIWQFTKELLRDRERRTVGRLDSRFKGIDASARGESTDYDPSMSAIEGPFTATLNHYVRAELGFESDLPYEILTGRVHPWNYDQFKGRYVNVASRLQSAMTRNQDLHVFVANGYYDLATPFGATEHTFNHLNLDPALRDHVTMGYYESGHMMYIHDESRVKMKDDLVNFYQKALAK